MLNLVYHDLMEKIEKHNGKKYLLIDDYGLQSQKKDMIQTSFRVK